MGIRNFKDDLNESNSQKLREEWNNKLKLILKDSKIEWKDAKDMQLSFGTDLIFTEKSGRRYSADVKTKKFLGDTYVLEIAHHIYNNELKEQKIKTLAGWLYKSTSDIIFYATIKDNEIISLLGFTLEPFKSEKEKEFISKLDTKWASTIFENGNYQLTLLKVIDLETIKQKANKYWYWSKNGST